MSELTATVEKWSIYELSLAGPSGGNPFVDVQLSATFTMQSRTVEVDGFYDGDGQYKVRFMPDMEGPWRVVTRSNCEKLDKQEAGFTCVAATAGNHGPVSVRNQFHFAYADGHPHFSVGTTCYAWAHQVDQLKKKTLESLAAGPFNKMRMCIFPKHYEYNEREPSLYPFEGTPPKGWDFSRFNPAFFQNIETCVGDLMNLGIEADLILFHAYDRWGFASMSREEDDRYVRYVVARLAAYRNVWWSLANEYDLLRVGNFFNVTREKTIADWDHLLQLVQACDPYQHLRSIHNCQAFFDYRKPWITHCSIQRQDMYKTAENTNQWREEFGKPIVIDEVAYEGNVNHAWGNIPGCELVRRFWEGYVRGGYVGHSETYLHEDENLWWSHGGVLRGDSPPRIAFLKEIMQQGPEQGIEWIPLQWDSVCGGVPGEYYIFYFGFYQPACRDFVLPEDSKFKAEIIDTWEMTIDELPERYSGKFRLALPGRQYMAVRFTKVG